MDIFLIFLLASFSLGFLHRARFAWRFLLVLGMALLVSFFYIIFRQI